MAKLSLPYIALRERPDGTIRPRFVPGVRVRALGFKGHDLRHPDGRWYTLDEARGFALERLREIEAVRAGGGKLKTPPRPRGRALGDLLKAWLASPDMRRRPEVTQRWYRKLVKAIGEKPISRAERRAGRVPDPEPFIATPVAAIGSPEVKLFFEYLVEARGHHSAVACIAAISGAYTFGRLSPEWRLGTNPAHKLKLPKPAARVVIWTREEIAAMVAAADALDRPEVGDGVMLGVHTGQRQNDRVALEDCGLVDGRRRFRQSKTGAIVDVPETPPLAARLAAARARNAALMLKRRRARPTTIIVSSKLAAALTVSGYSHAFDAVRAVAIAGIVDEAATAAARIKHAKARLNTEPPTVWKVPPCPSLAGKRDQDLRDTAVTWLARASCTLPEIASITGHSLRSIHTVLKHYLAITPELADSAIRKMVAWLDEQEKLDGQERVS